MVRDLLLDFRPFFLFSSRLTSESIVTTIVWFSVIYVLTVLQLSLYIFWLIRSLVDPTLAAFIVCGPLQFVLLNSVSTSTFFSVNLGGNC